MGLQGQLFDLIYLSSVNCRPQKNDQIRAVAYLQLRLGQSALGLSGRLLEHSSPDFGARPYGIALRIVHSLR